MCYPLQLVDCVSIVRQLYFGAEFEELAALQNSPASRISHMTSIASHSLPASDPLMISRDTSSMLA